MISSAAVAILTVILWKQASAGGLTFYRTGFNLSAMQIELNMAFYSFAGSAFIVAPLFSICCVSILVLLEQHAKKWLPIKK